MAINLKLLEQEKKIFELEGERDNLKEVVFDLMFEKQKVNSDGKDEPVQISSELQREFDKKHKDDTVSRKELLTLIKFANEQIKAKSEIIKKMQDEITKTEVAKDD